MLAEKQSGNAVANDLPEVRGKNLEYRFMVANNYILGEMIMALLNDPIIIILQEVITQSGHIPIALKVILCIVLACVGTIMGICMFRGGGE